MRRHLNYANVVATFALVFAMSGGALAAKHYLINSTKQIKPSVLKQLKGNAGKTGPAGPGDPPDRPGSLGHRDQKAKPERRPQRCGLWWKATARSCATAPE